MCSYVYAFHFEKCGTISIPQIYIEEHLLKKHKIPDSRIVMRNLDICCHFKLGYNKRSHFVHSGLKLISIWTRTFSDESVLPALHYLMFKCSCSVFIVSLYTTECKSIRMSTAHVLIEQWNLTEIFRMLRRISTNLHTCISYKYQADGSILQTKKMPWNMIYNENIARIIFDIWMVFYGEKNVNQISGNKNVFFG